MVGLRVSLRGARLSLRAQASLDAPSVFRKYCLLPTSVPASGAFTLLLNRFQANEAVRAMLTLAYSAAARGEWRVYIPSDVAWFAEANAELLESQCGLRLQRVGRNLWFVWGAGLSFFELADGGVGGKDSWVVSLSQRVQSERAALQRLLDIAALRKYYKAELDAELAK